MGVVAGKTPKKKGREKRFNERKREKPSRTLRPPRKPLITKRKKRCWRSTRGKSQTTITEKVNDTNPPQKERRNGKQRTTSTSESVEWWERGNFKRCKKKETCLDIKQKKKKKRHRGSGLRPAPAQYQKLPGGHVKSGAARPEKGTRAAPIGPQAEFDIKKQKETSRNKPPAAKTTGKKKARKTPLPYTKLSQRRSNDKDR